VLFGAHCSTAGGVWTALQRGRSIRCDVVQIFVKNNMQWLGKPFSREDLACYAKELAVDHFACVFGHTGYLINLGAPPSENRDRSIR
jgi:deoxyribonuclease-4